jgi:creatinine amidohydrolase
MKFGDLTYQEIRAAAEAGAVVIVPTGCTEQQGPHLTVDFDTWFVGKLCIAASETASENYGVDSLVMPVLPFGPTPEHRGFGAGFVDLSQSLHEAVIKEVLQSLLDQGFRRIVIWRGCGQHDLSQVVCFFQSQQSPSVRLWQPELPYKHVWDRIGDPEVPGGHADAFATAIALYLRPACVRKEKMRNPESREPDWDDPDLDFVRYSSTGVIGDPTVASLELAAELWREVVEEVARMLKQFASSESANCMTKSAVCPTIRDCQSQNPIWK